MSNSRLGYTLEESLKYSFVSLITTGLSMISPIRFGQAMSALNISEIVHTTSSFIYAPIGKRIQYKTR